ncbi:UDP-glucuronate 4-epimerase [Stylosanthes scabra]|uniref:UDP-glucuronate 4-epimerase n=1 Tax=Stylosanthes scabra TaxID=79078 RepID=A0ABU6VEP4_9FABA|nr:UDP-glucuronate 4-epimerase [Stylosanthes scabra]
MGRGRGEILGARTESKKISPPPFRPTPLIPLDIYDVSGIPERGRGFPARIPATISERFYPIPVPTGKIPRVRIPIRNVPHENSASALGDSSSTSSASSGFQEVRQQDNVLRIPSNLTILIIGAAGFVGAHVSFVLKHCGDKVLGLDNFNRDYNLNLKHAR